jgi:endonuclease/exonuclease/phosphatase (EEP) superfamily protein YafD
LLRLSSIPTGAASSHGYGWGIHLEAREVCLSLLITLALAGCVNVPVSDQLITSRDERIVRVEDAACSQGWQAFPAVSAGNPVLDSAGFTLMTWNVLKGRKEHWPEDYARLSSGQDIVLLEEAHLTPSLRNLLGQSGYRWYMTRAFDYNGAATGVLTAGRSPASGACLSRLAGPLILTPKSALLTRFPLGGSGEELWVANLHGINFTLGTARFRAQLESLAEALGSHTGPMILAGDFNDWSERMGRLRPWASPLSILKAGTFATLRATQTSTGTHTAGAPHAAEGPTG